MNPESPELEAEVEDALGAITEWRGGETELWKRALEVEPNAQRTHGVIASISGWSTSRKIFAAAATVAIVCAVGFSVRTMLDGGLFERQFASRSLSNQRGFGEAHPTYTQEWSGRRWTSTPDDLAFDVEQTPSPGAYPGGGSGPYFSAGGSSANALPRRGQNAHSDDPSSTTERAVVRKATMHLLSKEVRAVYLQAMHLISPARGEFVDSSAMSGSGETAEANITLRVAADRIDEVLNDLRDLAEVEREDKTGDDVTAQLVDLEARLRNEERIEQELLGLLDTREDSPLRDVLQLREEISKVRGSIERHKAQIAQMDRLVSLATILIIIRYDFDEEEPVEEETDEDTLGAYFGENIAAAWDGGVRFLADTIGFIVQVLIGGLIWWVIAIGCIIAAKQMKAKNAEAAAA